ncbi:DUF4333 domain-containing protein [Streptomyces sp. NPDC051940]|uniref:DUF4333 domain-containing protein n=1 Tax=Streptomyces sp. NPDC051940 TaxID=3155675 RepID=UPI003424A11D
MGGYMRNTVAGVVVAVAIGALAACSAEAGTTSSVGTEDLEKKVTTTLTEKVGQAPKSVDCPDKLKAEEGATTRCTLTAEDGSKIGLTVTAGKPDGDDVPIDIKVDDKPM